MRRRREREPEPVRQPVEDVPARLREFDPADWPGPSLGVAMSVYNRQRTNWAWDHGLSRDQMPGHDVPARARMQAAFDA